MSRKSQELRNCEGSGKLVDQKDDINLSQGERRDTNKKQFICYENHYTYLFYK